MDLSAFQIRPGRPADAAAVADLFRAAYARSSHPCADPAVVAAGTTAGPASAQNPPDGVEVLARGPVHEAFATTTEQPTVAALVTKRPPDAVEELPLSAKTEVAEAILDRIEGRLRGR